MLGISSSLIKKSAGMPRQYVKDGLKLYMPYRGSDLSKGTQFVGTGSTSFDGTNDYVDCGTAIGTAFGDSYDGGLSISMWVKANEVDEDVGLFTISNSFGSGLGEITIQEDRTGDGFMQFSCGGVDSKADFATAFIGVWTHIVGVFDGANNMQYLYLDGVLKDSDSNTNTLDLDGLKTIIGAYYSSSYGVEGSFKNVAIWSRALTATEVQNVMYKSYVNVSGRLASGLVSWWDLESDYLDSTDNDNDGTASGDPTQNADLYGGDTPVIPRGIDNAPTVQADAIGAGSALFDGDDYVQFPNIATAGSNTICFWIKSTNIGSEKSVFSMSSPAITDGFVVRQSSAGNYMDISGASGTGGGKKTGTGLVSNVWTHIAATKTTGAVQNIYVNGIDDTNATSENITHYVEAMIGGRNGAGDFSGNICQVGIWSKVLTQAQIQRVMERTFEEFNADDSTSLVSYWALDEAEDALKFDGTDDHISMGTSHGFPIGNADRSMSGWVSTTQTGDYKPLFGYGTGSSNSLFDIMNSGNEAYFAGHGNDLDSGTVINDGAWHHVAVTHDGGVVTAIYVDGVSKATGSKTLTTPADTTFYIMRYPESSGLAIGSIRQVGIYDVALTSAQILTQYNLGVDGDWSSDDDLIGYWKMTTASTSTDAVTDLSTNSNHGTISGNPTLVDSIVFDSTDNNNDGALI